MNLHSIPRGPENLVAVHRLCHSQIHDNPSMAKARGFLA